MIDDAVHITANFASARTLCGQPMDGLTVVSAVVAPDHDEGGAWCWTCLEQKPKRIPSRRGTGCR